MKDDGGHAFPMASVHLPGGMSLRDWFAGMSIEGMGCHRLLESEENEIANNAYRIADAMLKERAK